MSRLLRSATMLAFCSLTARPAAAALTDSEKAVIQTFIKKGELSSAARVRALVARPDLSAEEIAAPLRAGFAEASFDEAHARFTDALLFGQGSAAARNSLVPAVVEGLLARADSRMPDVPIERTARVGARQQAAVTEVLAIHAFVDEKIANAGHPPPEGHDGSMAVRDDAFGAVAKQYVEHEKAQARWLHAPGAVSSELVRVRVQVALALVDLARGVLGRHEVAEALGLDGARRGAFERDGVLVEANGAAEARVASAVRLLEGAPHAADGMSAWLLTKTSPVGLVGRGKIVRAGTVLGEALRPMAPEALWSDEVTKSSPDRGLAGVADSVALLATRQALARDPALASKVEAAGHHAARAGVPGYLAKNVTKMSLAPSGGTPSEAPPGSAVVAEAVRLLLLDAARAVDLAAIRERDGRPEPAEQLALAFTVLLGDEKEAVAGRTNDDGSVEAVPLSAPKRDGGLVTEVKVGSRRVDVVSDKASVFSITIDGNRPKLTGLASFRARPTQAESWDVDGQSYARLSGTPRAVALDDGRFVVEGSSAGFDAVSSGTPGSDVEVSAMLRPSGAGGGLVARAAPGEASYQGVALLLEPNDSQVRLLVMDGKGKARPLADPAKLAPPPDTGYFTVLQIVGDKVVAKVGTTSLTGKLKDGPREGRAGVAVRAGARLEVQKFGVKSAR